MQIIRWILIPFSVVYGLVTELRNLCYDLGILRSYIVPVKSICVGNLSVGGTGKTPHVAWLADQYCDRFDIVILSRGYGRKSKGFRWVNAASHPNEVGDEPLFYANRFEGKVKVAVCENRPEGVQLILKEYPRTNLILLDDAFQHRPIKAGLNILLTDFSRPYYSDFLLPVGNLRERRVNSKRANIITVTKCPIPLSIEMKSIIEEKINFRGKHILFSSITYSTPISFSGLDWKNPKNILLITGIANPNPLITKLSTEFNVVHLRFSDHHQFTGADLQHIHQKFDNFDSPESVILTTEKDYVRMIGEGAENSISKYPWYYIPISVEFEDGNYFKSIIDQYVGTV